jgi:hypothetical protein
MPFQDMVKHIVEMRGNNVPKGKIKLFGNTISTRLLVFHGCQKGRLNFKGRNG